MAEAVPVIQLDYAPLVTRAHRWWVRVMRILIVAGWVACLVGWILIVGDDVETVLVSGPLIFGIGITMMVGGIRLRYRGDTILGGCHAGICLLLFGLVVW